ncbi:MAG: hypothetical protein LBT03_02080 [Holosporales bacterium]|nr:hypothetical protein [Holosporales bacterium]
MKKLLIIAVMAMVTSYGAFAAEALKHNQAYEGKKPVSPPNQVVTLDERDCDLVDSLDSVVFPGDSEDDELDDLGEEKSDSTWPVIFIPGSPPVIKMKPVIYSSDDEYVQLHASRKSPAESK